MRALLTVLLLALCGCGTNEKSSTSGGVELPKGIFGGVLKPPPPVPLGPNDDTSYDWETNTTPNPRQRFIGQPFASSRTLEQTTRWLSWALLRYGKVPNRGDTREHTISEVKFDGCTMSWKARDYEPQAKFTIDYGYRVGLGSIRLFDGHPDWTDEAVGLVARPGSEHDFEITDVAYEPGTMTPKSTPRVSHEGILSIYILTEENAPARITWAIYHAAKLCGAPSSSQ